MLLDCMLTACSVPQLGSASLSSTVSYFLREQRLAIDIGFQLEIKFGLGKQFLAIPLDQLERFFQVCRGTDCTKSRDTELTLPTLPLGHNPCI